MQNTVKWVIGLVVVVVLAGGFYYLFIYEDNTNVSNETDSQNQMENTNTNANSIEGLNIEVLKKGSGPEAKSGDMVTVNYAGTLEDGAKFDSSYDRGTPFSFQLGAGRVIKGWDLGVLGMKVGEKRKLTIASDLGYGPGGYGPIPPNATLIFEVELLKIN